ncbi:MAG: phosphoribosylanthranilate isomerase [Vicinamibacterales bacterium]
MLIKICGITRAEDARLAISLGANALGFVFWHGSPRAVTPQAVAAILQDLPPLVTPVGVFVDPTAAEADAAWNSGIRVAQIIGTVPALPSGMALLRATCLAPSGDALEPDVPGSTTILLDAHDPVRRGGTGRTIDWTRAAAIAARRPVILAGGLQAANVAEAIDRVGPAGVDVSSGVESTPGIKDPGKLAAFVAAVRSHT